MNRKKICFILANAYSFFYTDSELIHGGAELQFYLLASELSMKNEFDVSFIVGNYNGEKITKINDISVYEYLNLEASGNIVNKIFNFKKYFFLLKKINADFYLTTSASGLVGLVGNYCRIFKKKHIFRTAHEMDVNGSFIKSNGLMGKLYKYGLLNADTVLTQTLKHQELLKNNYNIDAVLFKNGFNFNRYYPDISNKKNILWVARYQKWKQPELFLRLAAKFGNYKFVMICNYSEAENDKWQKLKNEAEKMSNVDFIDRIPFKDIQKYFNESLVFVNTSINEGFPNTFIQAGIAGTPILSLKVDPEDFINKHDCGFSCGNDFELMKNNLEILLNNSNSWIRKSKNVTEYIKNNYNIKNSVNILIDEIYKIKKTVFKT